MATDRRSHYFRLFLIGFKLLSGSAEIGAGILLLILGPSALEHLLRLASREELREDPADRLLALLQNRLPELWAHKHYFVAGLLVLGAIKIIGAVGLILRKPWGYYILVIVMLVLIPADLHHFWVARTLVSSILLTANLIALAVLLIYRSTFYPPGYPPGLSLETAEEPAV